MKDKIVEKVHIQVYFNLIHNILCNRLGIESFSNLERKSAYVSMHVSEKEPGVIEDPSKVTLTFGEHSLNFAEVEELLREHYDIEEEALITMVLGPSTVGHVTDPVFSPMDLHYEIAFEM